MIIIIITFIYLFISILFYLIPYQQNILGYIYVKL